MSAVYGGPGYCRRPAEISRPKVGSDPRRRRPGAGVPPISAIRQRGFIHVRRRREPELVRPATPRLVGKAELANTNPVGARDRDADVVAAVIAQAQVDLSLIHISEQMTEDTIFDLASLTKSLATATAVMQLYEQGKVQFDDPVPVSYTHLCASRKVCHSGISHKVVAAAGSDTIRSTVVSP